MEQGSSKNPVPCANNCGFFGSPATAHQEPLLQVLSLQHHRGRGGHHHPLVLGAEPGEVTATEAKEEEEGGGRGKRRCVACRWKVGLMGFKCRCGGVFCGTHRYSNRHGCSYDYRAAGRAAIARANPVVRTHKQLDKL